MHGVFCADTQTGLGGGKKPHSSMNRDLGVINDHLTGGGGEGMHVKLQHLPNNSNAMKCHNFTNRGCTAS